MYRDAGSRPTTRQQVCVAAERAATHTICGGSEQPEYDRAVDDDTDRGSGAVLVEARTYEFAGKDRRHTDVDLHRTLSYVLV